MPDYTSITVRKESEKAYQKELLDYQGEQGKKVFSMDFFDVLIENFKKRLR